MSTTECPCCGQPVGWLQEMGIELRLEAAAPAGRYAQVWWSIADLIDPEQEGPCPDWTPDKAAAFLSLIEDDLVATMIQAGRQELETLLAAYENQESQR